jgi:hypothetical protein
VTLSQLSLIDESIDILLDEGIIADSPKILDFFDDTVIQYLGRISSILLSDVRIREFPDVATFAFWIREASLISKKNSYQDGFIRKGLGLVVHIAPSNVPINFAFSWAFSLLAGNSNIVRVPTANFGQTTIILDAIRSANKQDTFSQISSMSSFIRYERSLQISEKLFELAHARVIWGGDKTVADLSYLHSRTGSRLITFPDKYSFSVISSKAIVNIDEAGLKRLAHNFLNDAYLFDQNACSSPRSIVWIGDQQEVISATRIFWNAVLNETSTNYQLAPANVVRKLALACELVVKDSTLGEMKIESPEVYRFPFSKAYGRKSLTQSRFGIFPESRFSTLSEIVSMIHETCQTITYFGFSESDFRLFFEKTSLIGVDRVVPIGQGLNMDMLWDGIDIPVTLSRVIDIR